MNNNQNILSSLPTLMWRVVHQSVKLSFMTVGHTKFAPDWCFGLLKQKFHRTKVDCLEDIVNVVESSASVNNAQLVGTQSGETVVKSYDWAGYFASKLKRVPQIKKQHHFVFTSSKPVMVTIKEFTDTETTEVRLLKDRPPVDSFTRIPRANTASWSLKCMFT